MNRSISRGRAQTLLSREMADGRARHLLAAFQNMGAGGDRDVINANSEQAVREPRSELAPAGLRRGDTDDALVLCTGWRLPAAQNAPAVDKGQVLELQGWHIRVGATDCLICQKFRDLLGRDFSAQLVELILPIVRAPRRVRSGGNGRGLGRLRAGAPALFPGLSVFTLRLGEWRRSPRTPTCTTAGRTGYVMSCWALWGRM